MELNSISFGDFVRLAKVIFVRSAESTKNYMMDSGLVRTLPISEHTGNTREFTEVDGNEYLTYKGEGDQAARGQMQQGYSATMTKYRVAENVGITYEMMHENKYPEVVRKLTNAGRKGYNTIDLDLSHRLTFGAATTYTDRDGRTVSIDTGDDLALYSTVHKLKGSTTTFRNRLANNPRLSKGAIEGMERLIVEETYSQLGEKKTMNFDILWITDDPNTGNTAAEILKSTGAPEAAHGSVVNVYKSKYKLVKLPKVATDCHGTPDTDKRYYWGIASSEYSTLYLGLWEAPHLVAPNVGGNGEDVQTDDLEFRNRAGYGIVTVTPAWIKFSSGDGA